MAQISLVTLLKCCVLLGFSQGCTIPTGIRGSWISSEKNELEFSTTSLSGYVVSTFSTSNFTCIDTSGNYYLLKSESFSRFGLQFHAYLCLSFSEVSSNLYTYYKHSAEEADANNERVLVKLAALTQATVSETCTVTNVTNVPYSVLMANGTLDSVKTTCPIPFLGDFSYTYDTGSGNLCPTESNLQVCDGSKDTMTFNYTYCSQIQAYSAGGVVSCVYSTSENSVYTLHVYNQDATTDQSTTYRFTCYRAYGYGTAYATQYPGDCPSTMNYTYVASPGATLTLNASVVCAYSDDSTTTLSAGVIAAIVILCLLLFFALIIGIFYYFYMKRKKRKQAEWEAANRKVDPEELSPNMRLGLPDESKYDLDRLMYSPDMKNGLIKRSPRKDMVGLEGLEGYKDGEKYINENERQTVLESQLFAEKRKRKDEKDEFNAAKRTNHIYSARIMDLAKGKKRPLRAATLAKIKMKPKARPMTNPSDTDGRATQTKDILIQVEEADGEGKRKTRFADEEGVTKTPKPDEKKAKKLEDVETLSDIVDNENAVDDLSDDDTREKRLILPNLRPEKTPKKKRPKDRFSLGKVPQTPNMPHNTRFMAPKGKRQDDEPDFAEPIPLQRGNPNFNKFHPLARIHRKDNPKAWKDAFGDKSGMESMDLETLKSQLPENRWKKLLEELYQDKKYFDYVKQSSSVADGELFSKADESLQYLYGRALFWEQQEPIPTRPSSSVKRMYSRYEPPGSTTRKLQRSSTTMSRSGHQRLPRTPSTQVSKMKRRGTPGKKDKNATNKDIANGTVPISYFEGGTQTEFSPVPSLTPLEFEQYIDRVSLPGSTIDENSVDEPMHHFTKELTKSDIKLEEYDGLEYIGEEIDDFNLQSNEDVTVAV